MPTLPSTSLTQIEVRTRGVSAAAGGGAKNIEFITHWRRTANVLPVNKANIGAAYVTAIQTPIAAALNARYTTSGIDVRFVNDATDAYETTASALPGLITGDSLPNYDAVVIQLHTGYRGKSGRGSLHLGPASESDSIGDVLNAGAITNFTAVITALAAGFTDADGNVWVQQVLSRKLSQLKTNPTTVLANDVTSRLLNKTTGTMRRRKVKTVN